MTEGSATTGGVERSRARIDAPLYDYGKIYRGTRPYLAVCPLDPDAARALVVAAGERGVRLRVRGGGHTFSGASLPRDREILVRTSGLDHYRFEAPGTVTAGAGAMVWDVRDLVREHGYDLPVFNGGWAGPTLGGYISAGGFGKSGLSEVAGGLWENVDEIRLVDGTGTVRTVTRADPEFPWIFGSTGQLGLLVEARLRLIRFAGSATAPRYPRGAAGRVPRRQEDDPAVNDAPPPPGGEDRLFWFTLLVAPRDESRAWEGLHELVLAHRDTLAPDGGWAGPVLDGEPIGYRYVIRFREFNPPLVYPRPETFLVVGVMSVLRSGDPAGNRRVLGIERDFVDMARARGLQLYLQAENIGGRVDRRAYYGERTYRHFRELRRRLDPEGRFNRGVVFPDDEV